MNFNEPEAEHTKIALLFDHSLEKLMKTQHPEIPYVLADNKCTERVSTMITELAHKANTKEHILSGGLSIIAHAQSPLEALAVMIGGQAPQKLQGYAFCPQCLAKAVLMCEEELQILKDCRQLALDYASR